MRSLDIIKTIQLKTMKGIEGLAKHPGDHEFSASESAGRICRTKVTAARDYKADTITDVATGEQ